MAPDDHDDGSGTAGDADADVDGPAIYPMPLHARLDVADVERSREWYEAVGFETVYAMPAMAHVRFARYADILLQAGDPPDADGDAVPGRGVTLSFTVDPSVEGVAFDGVDAVAERARAADATVVEGPVDRPYNVRELVLADPDGYRLTFTEQLDAERSFEDVMGGQ